MCSHPAVYGDLSQTRQIESLDSHVKAAAFVGMQAGQHTGAVRLSLELDSSSAARESPMSRPLLENVGPTVPLEEANLSPGFKQEMQHAVVFLAKQSR